METSQSPLSVSSDWARFPPTSPGWVSTAFQCWSACGDLAATAKAPVGMSSKLSASETFLFPISMHKTWPKGLLWLLWGKDWACCRSAHCLFQLPAFPQSPWVSLSSPNVTFVHVWALAALVWKSVKAQCSCSPSLNPPKRFKLTLNEPFPSSGKFRHLTRGD